MAFSIPLFSSVRAIGRSCPGSLILGAAEVNAGVRALVLPFPRVTSAYGAYAVATPMSSRSRALGFADAGHRHRNAHQIVKRRVASGETATSVARWQGENACTRAGEVGQEDRVMPVGVNRSGQLLEHLHAVHHLPRAGRILVEEIGQRLDRRRTSLRRLLSDLGFHDR